VNKWLNTKQACEILGIKQMETIYSYIRDGVKTEDGKTVKLKAYKPGGNGKNRRHWRIRERDLEEFLTGAESRHTERNNNIIEVRDGD